MTTRGRLNLAALERANSRLGRFIARYAEVGEHHPDHDIFLSAVVKGYEFTYGQAVIAIRRYVADFVLSPGQAGQMPLPDIIRVAARDRLIRRPEEWFDFRDRRNETAHEYYDEEAAVRIAETAPELHDAVTHLITSLQARMRDENDARSD